MSISAVNSGNAASQLAAFGRLSGTSSTSNSNSYSSVGGTPPPKPDDGAFLDAISSALSSIGVTVADGESDTSDDASTRSEERRVGKECPV